MIFAQESDTQEIPIAGAAYDSEQFEAEKCRNIKIYNKYLTFWTKMI